MDAKPICVPRGLADGLSSTARKALCGVATVVTGINWGSETLRTSLEQPIFVNALDSTGAIPVLVDDTVKRPKFDKKYIERLKASGVHAANFTVTWPGDNFEEAVRKTIAWRKVLEPLSSEAVIVTSVHDIEKARADNRFSVIFGSQDASMIEDRLEYLHAFYLLGHRVLQLTYQRRNLIGSGCGEKRDEGLSLFGVRVVEEMNRIGMLIDLSHCGPVTTAEAIELSEIPVAITHSNIYSISRHKRAKTDEHLRALAEKGGVLGISTLSQYIKPEGHLSGSDLSDYIDQIDYAVRLMGEDNVGIGLDNAEDYAREEYEAFTRQFPELKPRSYDNRVVRELRSVVGCPLVVEALSKRGYSERQIEKIIGGNFLRLFRQVWGG